MRPDHVHGTPTLALFMHHSDWPTLSHSLCSVKLMLMRIQSRVHDCALEAGGFATLRLARDKIYTLGLASAVLVRCAPTLPAPFYSSMSLTLNALQWGLARAFRQSRRSWMQWLPMRRVQSLS